jgi:hypothetical protein
MRSSNQRMMRMTTTRPRIGVERPEERTDGAEHQAKYLEYDPDEDEQEDDFEQVLDVDSGACSEHDVACAVE